MNTLIVVAIFQARPGKETALREALLGLVAPTLRERGCLGYTYHVAADSPGKFLSYETWATQADFDVHMKSSHVAALIPRVGELCPEFPQITFWEKLA